MSPAWTEWHSGSRRKFLRRVSSASAGLWLAGGLENRLKAAEGIPMPIVLFSKAYQPLKLNFEQAAQFTADAGLDGVDPPIRPDGEITPERAADELPLYVEALRKRGLKMPYITTAITGPNSPQTEGILRTAQKLGIKSYRLGFMFRESDSGWNQQLKELRARLKDLVALNKEIGIGAVLQNHSPSGKTYVGGNLDELSSIVEGFDPEQLGVAFDIAHALNVHGQGWHEGFEKIKDHLKVVYLKDCNNEKKFVPLGRGRVGKTDYFKLLKQTGYQAPISLHIEYSEETHSQPETRPELLNSVRQSLQTLRKWLA